MFCKRMVNLNNNIMHTSLFNSLFLQLSIPLKVHKSVFHVQQTLIHKLAKQWRRQLKFNVQTFCSAC